MANIFEELMRSGRKLTEESLKHEEAATVKKESAKKILTKNIKVESMRVFTEDENPELDAQFEVTPEEAEENEEEVVLVIDPEISAEEEVPEDAAEDMVGDSVYKCTVCGANYLCSCNDEGVCESVELDENGEPLECPICGDDAPQILVGEIAPVEGAGEEEPSVDPVDSEEEEEVPAEDDEPTFDEDPVEDEVPAEDEEEEVIEDSLKPMTEDIDDDIDDGGEEIIDEIPAEDVLELEPSIPVEEVPDEEPAPAVEIDADLVNLVLDDKRLESMMTQMIRENYNNKATFEVSRVAVRKGKFVIEYFVRDGAKTKKGQLVGEGFNPKSRVMKISFKDKGAFTESFTRTPAFILECVKLRSVVVPTSMEYNYRVKVKESLYAVEGKIVPKRGKK